MQTQQVELSFKLGRKNLGATGTEQKVKGVLDVEMIGFEGNAAVHTVYVVDCSYSMEQELRHIIDAFEDLHVHMGPDDRIGIVRYSGKGEELVVLPLSSKDEFADGVGIIRDRKDGLIPIGSTHAQYGLKLAVDMLKGSTAPTRLVVLITDGEESDRETGEIAASEQLRDRGVRIVPVVMTSQVPARFVDHLMKEDADPASPVLPVQSATTADDLRAIPALINDAVRARIGTDVAFHVNPSGLTTLEFAYEVAPAIRALILEPDPNAEGQFIMRVQDDLRTDGLSVFIESSVTAPDPEYLGDQPYFVNVTMTWIDLKTGQEMSVDLGKVDLTFVMPDQADQSPAVEVKDLARLVAYQRQIDQGRRYAAVGDIDKSIAAFSDAASIAATMSGEHGDLASAARAMGNEVGAGGVSALSVSASIAASTSLAGTKIKGL